MRVGSLALPLILAFSALIAACQGCKNPQPPNGAETLSDKPTVRLYLMSDVAGALEPCGCSKAQLGGLDHLAAFVKSEAEAAPNRLVLSAGPLLFIDPTLKEKQSTQARWKAEAIARAGKAIGLSAWAPGYNDWAGGADLLKRLAEESGAALLGVGLGAAGITGSKIFEVDGVKVGVVGLSDPRAHLGTYPAGVSAPGEIEGLLGKELEKLKADGAQILIGLAAVSRGVALRIAEKSGLHVLLVGVQSAEGEGNSAQAPPEIVGDTLVVGTANHAQTVAVVDIYLRGQGPVKLADAGGVARAAEVADLSRRIRELETRINSWELGGKVEAADIAARKVDLEKLTAQRAALEKEEQAPKGSFFRYRVVEMREELGTEPAVEARMLEFYKRVNEHNKKAFADLLPPAVGEGQASYMGIEACSSICHTEEREVWDKTAHAHAYAVLQKGFKEYNLDCVGCHVTGYDRPGGSTVTHNETLRDVQCEDCHGPGSLHAKDPKKEGLIELKPDPKSCVARCHHPPHVEGFDAVSKMDLVLGPGHGKD